MIGDTLPTSPTSPQVSSKDRCTQKKQLQPLKSKYTVLSPKSEMAAVRVLFDDTTQPQLVTKSWPGGLGKIFGTLPKMPKILKPLQSPNVESRCHQQHDSTGQSGRTSPLEGMRVYKQLVASCPQPTRPCCPVVTLWLKQALPELLQYPPGASIRTAGCCLLLDRICGTMGPSVQIVLDEVLGAVYADYARPPAPLDARPWDSQGPSEASEAPSFITMRPNSACATDCRQHLLRTHLQAWKRGVGGSAIKVSTDRLCRYTTGRRAHGTLRACLQAWRQLLVSKEVKLLDRFMDHVDEFRANAEALSTQNRQQEAKMAFLLQQNAALERQVVSLEDALQMASYEIDSLKNAQVLLQGEQQRHDTTDKALQLDYDQPQAHSRRAERLAMELQAFVSSVAGHRAPCDSQVPQSSPSPTARPEAVCNLPIKAVVPAHTGCSDWHDQMQMVASNEPQRILLQWLNVVLQMLRKVPVSPPTFGVTRATPPCILYAVLVQPSKPIQHANLLHFGKKF